MTEKRRPRIERWLQIALKHKKLSKKVLKYLELSEKILKSDFCSSATPDESLVLDFIDKLSGCKNNKMAQIDKFSWLFFSVKRTVSEVILKKLLEVLIPLGSYDLCGGKVLDILTKLTSSDHFKDFSLVSKVFANIDVFLLKDLGLNEYLTRKKFADSQLQAYNLCKIYEEHTENLQIFELVKNMQLKNDESALRVYESWGVRESIEKNFLVESFEDWRQLICEENYKIKFRFLGKELDICSEIVVESTMKRIVDILIKPEERIKWDIMLFEMNMIGEDGFVFTYLSGRTIYEFHTISSIIENASSTEVNFSTTCYEKQQTNSKLGKINSHYEIERIEDQPHYSNESEEKQIDSLSTDLVHSKVRIVWRSHYCETSFALVRGDVFQEADFLRKTLERFICVAEDRTSRLEDIKKLRNPLIHTFERKKLDRASL